jgi:hypothetical protein
VDVQRAGRRALQQAAQLVGDLAIASGGHVLHVAERAVGMDAGADRGAARPAQAPTQRCEGGDRLGRVRGHRGRELDERRVRVRMGRPRTLGDVHALEHVASRVHERMRDRVDEDELLLDPQREVRFASEPQRRERRAQPLPRLKRARTPSPNP